MLLPLRYFPFLFLLLLKATVEGRPASQDSLTEASAANEVCSTLGCAQGASSGAAIRYTLPYALPPLGNLRFANPQPVGKFNTIVYNATVLPHACYQYDDDNRGVYDPESEDCLYLNVYKPASSTSRSNLPVMFWIHGGSFIGGSATAVGLDGSKLASAYNVVVVIVQYRLGAFGFLQTTYSVDESSGGKPGDSKVAGNQAVRDVELALKYVNTNIGAYGGDPDKVTLFGQSSGAHMIRTLLTVPTVEMYFAKAIMASDTADYGLAPQKQMNLIGKDTLSGLNCTTISCARKATARDVLTASINTYNSFPAANPSSPIGEVFRPTKGLYITSALEEDADAGKGVMKPLIFTTVLNEAGHVVGSTFDLSPPDAITLTSHGYTSTLSFWVEYMFKKRGTTIMGSKIYSHNASHTDSLRKEMERIATDGLWRCGNQYNARNLAAASSKVWLGAFNLGIQYPSNTPIGYCTGKVCHEDDILAIFGTYPSGATEAQKALSKEVQDRYVAFARSSNPNVEGYAPWNRVVGSDLNLLRFGVQKDGGSSSNSAQSAAACGTKGIWGRSVKFDWQLYSS